MKVMLAQQDSRLRNAMAGVLAAAGYEGTAVADGFEAWLCLMRGGVDICVLDMDLPEIDGLELLKMIRRSGRFFDIPVLMVAAVLSAGAQSMVAGQGGDACLQAPPLDERAFLARIKELEGRIL